MVLAQEGVIHYDVIHDLRQVKKTDSQGMSNLPDSYLTKHVLYFNPEASFYTNVISQKEERQLNSGQIVGFPLYDVYLTPASNKRLLTNSLKGRTYMIEDTMGTRPWVLSEETKEILGYPCRKATLTNSENKGSLTVWFTNQLRPALGPYLYHTLPGAVLEVDSNQGALVLKATNVELRALTNKELAKPGKGKLVTKQEFENLLSK